MQKQGKKKSKNKQQKKGRKIREETWGKMKAAKIYQKNLTM